MEDLQAWANQRIVELEQKLLLRFLRIESELFGVNGAHPLARTVFVLQVIVVWLLISAIIFDALLILLLVRAF